MPRKKHYQWHAGNDGAAPADLPPSRSAKKRQSHALQELGEELTRLGPQEVRSLNLPPDLTEALDMYSRIREHEARRRQLQYIGRLMRDVDPEPLRAALDARKGRDAAATAALHLAEQWRDRLIADDDAIGEWLTQFPGTDSQQLRALARQARKDAQPDKTSISQGLAPRRGRAYREIFQLVREQMRQISLRFVPTAILSRQCAVIRDKSLIINLPGQPKAIQETLEGLKSADGQTLAAGIFAAVPYCIDLIGGPYIETRDEVCKSFRPKSAVRPIRPQEPA